MKKFMLGTVIVGLIFTLTGCGKTAQSTDSSSKGNGTTHPTSQTFSMYGYVSTNIQNTDGFEISVRYFASNELYDNNVWTSRASDGFYEITGLPLGTMFVVTAEKGNAKFKNLAYGNTVDQKRVDLTSVETAMVEAVSANSIINEILNNFNSNMNISTIINETQEAVEAYYNTSDKLNALETAISSGIPLVLPTEITNALNTIIAQNTVAFRINKHFFIDELGITISPLSLLQTSFTIGGVEVYEYIYNLNTVVTLTSSKLLPEHNFRYARIFSTDNSVLDNNYGFGSYAESDISTYYSYPLTISLTKKYNWLDFVWATTMYQVKNFTGELSALTGSNYEVPGSFEVANQFFDSRVDFYLEKIKLGKDSQNLYIRVETDSLLSSTSKMPEFTLYNSSSNVWINIEYIGNGNYNLSVNNAGNISNKQIESDYGNNWAGWKISLSDIPKGIIYDLGCGVWTPADSWSAGTGITIKI